MQDDPNFDPYDDDCTVLGLGEHFLISENEALNSADVRDAAVEANQVWSEFAEISVAGKSLLDMMDQKVISGMVGEIFRTQLEAKAENLFSNPRDDGHPDLCLISPKSNAFLARHDIDLANIRMNLSKEIWTPFGGKENPLPGVEIKATVVGGLVRDVRGPRYINTKKPSWSAHHQETPVLLGIVWDYVKCLPKIIAAYFSNNLDTIIGAENRHWTAVSTPSKGSKGTSSCSMTAAGSQRMFQKQLLEPADPKIRLMLEIATGKTIPLKKELKPKLRGDAKSMGIKLSHKGKDKKKDELVDEILKRKGTELIDSEQYPEVNTNQRVVQLLKEIGHQDYAPTDNYNQNMELLKHFVNSDETNIDLTMLSSLFKTNINLDQLVSIAQHNLEKNMYQEE